MPSTAPKADGDTRRYRTRYTGMMLATISEEMSVSRLVKPSAHTTGLIGRRTTSGEVATGGFRHSPRTLGQSIEYMCRSYRSTTRQIVSPRRPVRPRTLTGAARVVNPRCEGTDPCQRHADRGPCGDVPHQSPASFCIVADRYTSRVLWRTWAACPSTAYEPRTWQRATS